MDLEIGKGATNEHVVTWLKGLAIGACATEGGGRYNYCLFRWTSLVWRRETGCAREKSRSLFRRLEKLICLIVVSMFLSINKISKNHFDLLEKRNSGCGVFSETGYVQKNPVRWIFPCTRPSEEKVRLSEPLAFALAFKGAGLVSLQGIFRHRGPRTVTLRLQKVVFL